MKRILAVALTLAILLTGLFATASAATANGWQKDGDNWQYFENGKAVTETWVKWNGNWYYFDEAGVMRSDGFLWKKDGTTWKDEETGETVENWIPTYFLKKDGTMLAGGWYYYKDEYNDFWIYANADGTLPHQWAKIDGDWYYFWHGRMYQDELIWPQNADGTDNYNGTYYAVGNDGTLKTDGWFGDKNWWKSEYDESKGEWVEVPTTEWFYASEDGSLVRGWKWIDNNWYYFSKTDVPYMYSDGVSYIDDVRYVFDKDGALVTSRWYNIGSSKYPSWRYLNADGAVTTGWFQVDGKWYYANSYGYVMRDGVYPINGTRYAFDSDCALVEGWYKNGNNWYYGTENGILMNTWKQDGANWYYFGRNGVMYADGEYTIEGKTYSFDKNGAWINK